MNISITSFNSGEMSPLMQARSDTQKHASGCKRMENFIPRVSGAILRRPGMRFLSACRDETKKVTVKGLSFGVDDSVVLEIGHLYFRVFNRDGTVQVLSGSPKTHRVSPWTESHLHELQFCQVNDLVYVVHPSYPPYLITRRSASEWDISPVSWDWPMMADENITDTTLALSGTTLTASTPTFKAGHVGAHFALSHRRAQQSAEARIDAETPSTESKACTLTVVDGNIQVNINAHGWVIDSEITFTTTGELLPGIEVGKKYYVVAFGLVANSFFVSPVKGGPVQALDAFPVIANEATNVIKATGSDFYNGQPVVFSTSVGMPNPLVAGTIYYVKSVNIDQFYVAATAGGTAINLTTNGVDVSCYALQSGIHTAKRQFSYPLATPADTTVLTSVLRIYGKATIFTFGAWAGTVKLMRVVGAGSEVVQSWTANGDRNLAVEVEQYPEAQLFLEVTAHKIAPQLASETWGRDARFVLEAADAVLTGLVKVASVASATAATVEIVSAPLDASATTVWAESAWSGKRGYPRAIGLHNQRLFFCGTRDDPQTIWGSAIGDFHNFRRSTLDDAAIVFSVATTENNLIQWLTTSAGGIIVGTSGDEWTITAENGLISATNVQVKRQSRYGSKYLQALAVNEVVLFVQRGGRKLREHVFSFERDGYIAPDLTLLADHITRGGVKSMALMQQPDAIVWFVRNDGMLIGMTYEREQQVVAWHKHPTAGEVESVATIYGDQGDELWMVVKRGGRRFIERLDPQTFQANEANATSEGLCYLDSSKMSTSGIDHLNGSTVEILADGSIHPPRTVTSGAVALERAATSVCVGLPFTSLIHLNSFEAPMQDGPSKSRKWKANRAALRYWQSRGAEISANATDNNQAWERLEFRSSFDPMDSAPLVKSGITECALIARFDEAPEIAVRQNQPLPLNVVGIVVKGDFYGD